VLELGAIVFKEVPFACQIVFDIINPIATSERIHFIYWYKLGGY